MSDQNTHDPAKEAAKAKARQHVEEHGMPERDQTGQPIGQAQLTTAAQLLAGYKTGFFTAQSGRQYEIQLVQPGDFARFIRVPVLSLMVEKGVNIADPEATQAAIKEMDEEEMIMTVEDDRFIDLARRIVCAGVINVKFRMEPQAHLDDKSGEVSIQLIPAEEAIELYNAIMELSFPKEVADEMRSFRKELEEKIGRGNQDSSDVAGVQPEAQPDAIPEVAEP